MIITTTPKNNSDIKNIKDIRRDILFGVTERIAHEIKIGSIGVYMTGDETSTEYELVKFHSYPYTIQNSEDLKEIKSNCERVVDIIHFNKYQNFSRLYYLSKEHETIKLRHFVKSTVTLQTAQQVGRRLPSTLKNLECGFIDNQTHDSIIDEIQRRESIDFDEIETEDVTYTDDEAE